MNKQQNAELEAERVAFDEWLPNYYSDSEDSAARAGWEAAIEYARAQLAAPAGVSYGWRLVPVEPTLEMLGAALMNQVECIDTIEVIRTDYKAMLASAPSPETASEVWMIPTVKQLEQALESVPSFHDLSAELIAPTLRENLIAAMGKPASDVVPVPRELLELIEQSWRVPNGLPKSVPEHVEAKIVGGLAQLRALLNGGRV